MLIPLGGGCFASTGGYVNTADGIAVLDRKRTSLGIIRPSSGHRLLPLIWSLQAAGEHAGFLGGGSVEHLTQPVQQVSRSAASSFSSVLYNSKRLKVSRVFSENPWM